MASVSLTDKQKVIVTAQALDSTGLQVDFTAPPTFEISDLSLGSFVDLAPSDPTPAAGQFAKWFVASADGSGTITVSEDAVLGDDTTKVSGTLDVSISKPVALAASVSVSASAAAAQ